MKIDELTGQVMDDWNSISIPFMLNALQIQNDPDHDDIWRTLLKIPWPWHIMVVDDVSTQALTKAYSCEFKFTTKLSKDYKMTSAVIAGMAAVLRQHSDQHLIAVFDDQHCGYGFRYEGKDDVTIKELNGFRHIT